MFINKSKYKNLCDTIKEYEQKNKELSNKLNYYSNKLDVSADENIKLCNSLSILLNLYGNKVTHFDKIPYTFRYNDSLYDYNFDMPKYYRVSLPALEFNVDEGTAKRLGLMEK